MEVATASTQLLTEDGGLPSNAWPSYRLPSTVNQLLREETLQTQLVDTK